MHRYWTLHRLLTNNHNLRQYFTDTQNNGSIFNDRVLDKIHKLLITNISNENIVIPVLTLFIFSQKFNHEINGNITKIQTTIDLK